MPNRVVITLTDEQKARLEAIAFARGEPLVAAVEEAVTAFIHREGEYGAYVQEGIDSAAKGEVRDWDEIESELRETFGDVDG